MVISRPDPRAVYRRFEAVAPRSFFDFDFPICMTQSRGPLASNLRSFKFLEAKAKEFESKGDKKDC